MIDEQQAPNTIDPLDDLINHSFAEAEKAEQDAQLIERRLRLSNLDHCDGFFAQQRMQGEVRNCFSGRHKNLTAASQLTRKDPQLASYLQRLAGVSAPAADHDAAEREAARQASIQHLQEMTEQLRQRNEATRKAQDAARLANLPNKPGSRSGGFYI
jgi:hypothetical protein